MLLIGQYDSPFCPTCRDSGSALRHAGRAAAVVGVRRCGEIARYDPLTRAPTLVLDLYPAHAACGGYKQSGIGHENHKMMLNHYQQTKNLLVSDSPKALGFFRVGGQQ